ncbi:MAG: signal peptidase [Pseudonocardiales bacterium]|nr:signal peptidase [Pseudonocardiales bacterium]
MYLRNGVRSGVGTWRRFRSTGELKSTFGQRSMVLAIFLPIIVLDQTVKWWAWRSVSTACINQGGDVLVGSTVSGWYSDSTQGAVLDVLAVGFLSVAISLFWRRRQSLPVLVSGCMMIAGWSSNVLDRIGLHDFTAPGSPRGAVDFIPIGVHYYNVADMFIIAGTPLFVLALAAGHLAHKARRRTTAEALAPAIHDRRLQPTAASAGDAA